MDDQRTMRNGDPERLDDLPDHERDEARPTRSDDLDGAVLGEDERPDDDEPSIDPDDEDPAIPLRTG